MVIFDKHKVNKFFDILNKLDRHEPIDLSNYRYLDDVGYPIIEKEIFIRRVLKQLLGQYVILYLKNKDDIYYKKYILIENIEFGYKYSDDLKITIFNYNIQEKEILYLEKDNIIKLEGKFIDRYNNNLNSLIENIKIEKRFFKIVTIDKVYEIYGYTMNDVREHFLKTYTGKILQIYNR